MKKILMLSLPLLAFPVRAEVAAVDAVQEKIPFKSDHSFASNLGASLTAIIVFLVVAGIAMMLMRRYSWLSGSIVHADKSDAIKLLSSKRLGMKTAVHLISVNDKEVLITLHGESIRMLEIGAVDHKDLE